MYRICGILLGVKYYIIIEYSLNFILTCYAGEIVKHNMTYVTRGGKMAVEA